jgi:ABC-type proline/glycine betaine transport system ATPase subunit
MVNRLIEPTTGRIVLDGDDVTSVDVRELRRRIGYVIQQVATLSPTFWWGNSPTCWMT